MTAYSWASGRLGLNQSQKLGLNQSLKKPKDAAVTLRAATVKFSLHHWVAGQIVQEHI